MDFRFQRFIQDPKRLYIKRLYIKHLHSNVMNSALKAMRDSEVLISMLSGSVFHT